MKIIHCADLHLDARMTSYLSKEQAKERKNEILRTFIRMVSYADEHKVRAIIIAGDLFDTRNVSATVRNAVRDVILEYPQIDFLYLKGNHDQDNFLSRLDDIPENLKLFGDTWTTYSYGNVTISGLELSAENQAYAYNSLVLDHDRYNIVTLHGQLMNYSSKEKAEVISLDQLKNKNIDYLALGHVHSYETGKIDGRGTFCYCGCLEGRGFDECGEKGFVLLSIDEENRVATSSFVSKPARTLYTIPVDVSGTYTTNDVARRIETCMNQKAYSSKSLVKFVLIGEVDVESERNLAYLQDLFANDFYYVRIKDETKLSISYGDYEKDESLKGEFIRMVLASDLSEEEKTQVIRCGISALSNEEVAL